MPVEFKECRYPAPNALFERMAQQMESHIGDHTLSDAGSSYSVDHACLKNVRVIWQEIGGSAQVGDPAYASTAAVANDKMRRHIQTSQPVRGALVCWDSSTGQGAGHIGIADGDGNSVNNWSSNTIVVTPLSEQKTGYLGWVDPKYLGATSPTGEELANPDAGTYTEAASGSEDSGLSLPAEGDYAKVKQAYSSRNLRDAVFNPPVLKFWSNSASDGSPTQMEDLLRAQRSVNKPGFIVRDPLFMGEARASSAEGAAKRNRAKANSEADSGGADSATGGWLTFTTNYGFRFLYNPSTYNEGYSSTSNGDPFQMLHEINTQGQAVVGASGASIGVNLILYRKLDVELLRWLYETGKINEIDTSTLYGENVSEPMLKRIMTSGTMVDVEQIFRLCNGDPQDTWHGKSSDWGILLPTMVAISLGDGPSSRRLRGMLTGMTFNHGLFASGMVPVYTEVTLTLNRIVDQYYTASSANAPSADLLGGAAGVTTQPTYYPGGREQENNPQPVPHSPPAADDPDYRSTR